MPRPQRPRRRRCWSSCLLTILVALVMSIAHLVAASRFPSTTQDRRSLLTFGIGPAFPAGVGAGTTTTTTTTPGAAATAPAAAAPANGAPAKLRTCAGPFEICPAPALCRNPNKGNEWCYWLYVDKASCVCL